MKTNDTFDNIPLTIETQLESYTRYRNSTHRHDVLWHAWNHSKGWIEKLLMWTLPSFPSYSLHDASHAESVLHNIEMILGEQNIKKLSASDCFMILHTVYIHDVGMCITAEYRREQLKNPEFQKFLHQCKADISLKKYADVLLADTRHSETCGSKSIEKSENDDDSDYKLTVYYGIMYLVSEFRRKRHAEESKKMLNGWIRSEDKLGSGFSTSGIAKRFFYCIADCASVHNSWDFSNVMKLVKSDSGYVNDFIHPRLIAVLVQLGDSLDMDNDRFHPLMEEFLEGISDTTKSHIGKHESIRRLMISPKKIAIHADCSNTNELRVVQAEYNSIRDILKNASSNWASICPNEYGFILPELRDLKLLLNDKEIPEELVNTKFVIQQDKAFHFLQGSNIYRERRYAFLRELYQNAVDATKIQFWNEWKGGKYYSVDTGCDCSEQRMKSKISVERFPIEVNLYMGYKKRYEREYCLIKSFLDYTDIGNIDDLEFGVIVEVRDYGSGMSKNDIRAISDVGTSYNRENKKIKEMPDWLRPTGEFGVGLQSVFLVADFFNAKTHVRHGECFNIEFNATGEMKDGYINVTPLNKNDYGRYGTCFSVFVPAYEKTRNAGESYNWRGNDPFQFEGKDELLNFARELSVRMLIYLNKIVVEYPLFPTIARLYEYDAKQTIYNNLKKEYDFHLQVEIIVDEKNIVNDEEYSCSNSGKCINESFDNEHNYKVDFEGMCLVVSNKTTTAKLSPRRLIELYKNQKNMNKSYTYPFTRIYYKGIYVTEMDFNLDMCLLDYIDIKCGLKREHLAFNRSEFTELGMQYIKDFIYHSVIENVWNCLGNIAEKDSIFEKECKNYFSCNNMEGSKLRNIGFALFFSGLGVFYNARIIESHIAPIVISGIKERRSWWNDWIKEINSFVKGDEKLRESTLFNISFYKFIWNGNELNIEEDDGQNHEEKSAIEVLFDSENENSQKPIYAVVSIRKEIHGSWDSMLVEIVCKEKESWIKDLIVSLKSESNEEKRLKIIDKIDDRLESLSELFDKAYKAKSQGNISVTKRRNENLVLTWVMENMPCLAMHSSYDKKMHINIIDYVHSDSIYQSRLLKREVYEHMADLYKEKKIQRFSTITSTSFCQLGVDKIHESVYFVKRGKLSWIGKRDLIVPLTGDVILGLIDKRDNGLSNRVLNYLENKKIDLPTQDKSKIDIWNSNNLVETLNNVMEKDSKNLEKEDIAKLSLFIDTDEIFKIGIWGENFLNFCSNIDELWTINDTRDGEDQDKEDSYNLHKATKNRLIEYVANESWVKQLDRNRVDEMYSLFIKDMIRSLEEPLWQRKKLLKRK